MKKQTNKIFAQQNFQEDAKYLISGPFLPKFGQK